MGGLGRFLQIPTLTYDYWRFVDPGVSIGQNLIGGAISRTSRRRAHRSPPSPGTKYANPFAASSFRFVGYEPDQQRGPSLVGRRFRAIRRTNSAAKWNSKLFRRRARPLPSHDERLVSNFTPLIVPIRRLLTAISQR